MIPLVKAIEHGKVQTFRKLYGFVAKSSDDCGVFDKRISSLNDGL